MIMVLDFVKVTYEKYDKTYTNYFINSTTLIQKYLLEATKLKLIDYLTKPIDFKIIK